MISKGSYQSGGWMIGCWRSLPIKSDCQLRHKKRINKQSWSHMHLQLTKFHMYLENIILQVTNTIHGIIHRKVLFDADLRKGTRETPINLVQTGQNTTEQGSMSSPWPASLRRWRAATVKGQPPADAASCASLWRWHAPMLRRCIPCFRAKDR